MSKPKASDRTVDMFSGTTPEEDKNEAERIQQGLDNVEQPKDANPAIEANVDRWRASAFAGREFVSKHFGLEQAQENQYRISVENGVIYLEKTATGGSGAYSYAGVFLPEGDLPVLARLFVDAAKDYMKRKK